VKRLDSKFWFQRALVSVTLACLFCSCGDGTQPLIRLVPQDSCAILSIDWSSIKTDPDLRQIIKAKQLEDLLQRLHIDGGSIKSIVVFSGIDGKSSSGLLLRGRFESKQVVADLKTHGWNEQSLDGDKVYVNTSEYIALPAPDTLFAGTREATLGVFRAKRNASESLVGSSLYKKLNTGITTTDAKPIKAFLLIPQGTLDMADAALTATSVALSFFNLGGIGQLLKAMNVARGFAFTVDHVNHERYPVELSVLMRDEDAAVFMSGSLNAMKQLSQLAADDARDQLAIREFRKMTITRRDEVLAVKMEMPAEALFPPSHR
jgi:hypothetical protein